MPGKIGAMVAAVAAAASAIGAASWAKRRKDANSEPELETAEAPEVAEVGEAAEVAEVADVPEPASFGGGGTPAPASEAPAGTGHDDLTAIKGLGKVKAAKLVDTGVTSYAQIAAWSDDDIAEVGLQVNTSPGQIKREDWVGQAKALGQG